jgi:hypothetical protein
LLNEWTNIFITFLTLKFLLEKKTWKREGDSIKDRLEVSGKWRTFQRILRISRHILVACHVDTQMWVSGTPSFQMQLEKGQNSQCSSLAFSASLILYPALEAITSLILLLLFQCWQIFSVLFS